MQDDAVATEIRMGKMEQFVGTRRTVNTVVRALVGTMWRGVVADERRSAPPSTAFVDVGV